MNEHRIIGPPGTGKTTTLSKMLRNSADSCGLDRVCAVSFTKTAAKELLSRGLPIPEEHVGTLHGMCYRLMDGPKLVHDKKTITEWNDHQPYMKLSGGEVSLDDPWAEAPGSTQADFYRQEYNRYRSMQRPRELWSLPVQRFAEKWEAFKDDTGKMDFIDLIQTCIDQHLTPDTKVLFADECQDFSPQELDLVRQWGRSMEKYYLVGDANQCIYSFRGCTPNAFLFPDIPQDQKIFLEHSYRLPRAIHAHVTRKLQTITPREDHPYYPRDAEGAIYRHTTAADWPEMWVPHITRALEQGDVMVLMSCSYLLVPLLKHLRAKGLIFSNRWRPQRKDWNPLSAKQGTTSALDRVGALLRPHRAYWGNQSRMWSYADMDLIVQAMSAEVCIRGAKADIKRKATATPGMEIERGCLDTWFPKQTIQALATGDLAWMRQHLLAASMKPMGYAMDIVRRQGNIPDLETVNRLTVGTIHSCKGGEADSVFVFSGLSAQGVESYVGSQNGRMAVKRQFYVGETRAKDALYLMDGGVRSMPGIL